MAKSKAASLKSEDTKRVNTSLRLQRKTLKALKIRAIEGDTSIQKIIEELLDGYLKKTGSKKS